jgi:hypothetical protein
MKILLSILRPFIYWKNILSAFPCFLMFLLYAGWAGWLNRLTGMEREELSLVMGIEFIVIHSFPFIFLIALAKPAAIKWKIARWIGFWGMLAFYIWMAYYQYKFWGLISFLGVTLVTYIGFLLRLNSPRLTVQLVARWIFTFVAYLVSMGTSGMPENVSDWGSSGNIFIFGMMFFLFVGFLEWTGIYQRIADSNIANFS